MPEREYFSLRYAIPGFTLILIVLGMNFLPLLRYLSLRGLESVFGAFLAFLTLFSGSAIGFLLSQIYWAYYSLNKVPPAVLDELKEPLRKSFGFTPPLDKIERDVVVSSILDYLMLKSDRLFWDYTQKRWDMRHILSSTILAMVAGLGIGVGLRLYFLFLVQYVGFISMPEQVFTLIIFLIVSALMFVVQVCKRRVFDEYTRIMRVIILGFRGNERMFQDLRIICKPCFPEKMPGQADP